MMLDDFYGAGKPTVVILPIQTPSLMRLVATGIFTFGRGSRAVMKINSEFIYAMYASILLLEWGICSSAVRLLCIKTCNTLLFAVPTM